MSANDTNLVAAENYERHVARNLTAPFAAILLEYARPMPGEQVVDVACGTGIVSRLAAPLVGPAGSIVGVDSNPAMLAVARAVASPGDACIDWREGSALALPLPDDTFDLAICMQGLQFMPDRLAALREMRRVLKPGARIAISVWSTLDKNPVSELVMGNIARRLKTPISTFNPAFSLGDEGELLSLLEQAGFTGVKVAARSQVIHEPRNPNLVKGLLEAVSAVLPAFAAMDPSERAALAEEVESEIMPALQKYLVEDEQISPMAANNALAYKA